MVDKILKCLQSEKTTLSQLGQIKAQIILQTLQTNTVISSQFIIKTQTLNLLNPTILNLFNIPQTRPYKTHTFTFNTLIRSFSQTQQPQTSLYLYAQMLKTSVSPNHFTFTFLIRSLSALHCIPIGHSVFAHVTKFGFFEDVYVANALTSFYSDLGETFMCRRVFDEMRMRDVVSWTALITANRKAKRYDDALIDFERMRHAGVSPNHVTMVNALSSCAAIGALDLGIWIHKLITKNEWELDVILGTCLVDMYGKCGKIDEAVSVFRSMEERNVFTWNALINGLALAKSGDEAVQWFSMLVQEGIQPDEVTLLVVLSACNHSGQVEMGRKIFNSIVKGKFRFYPNAKHYACMVDILARSGNLVEAFRVVTEMPFEPTESIWGALLAGSKKHGQLELSEIAAKKLVNLMPENGAYYVMLSNLYAKMEKWEDLEAVRRVMKERGIKKDSGSSTMSCV